mgnify:CR=1 FL=1
MHGVSLIGWLSFIMRGSGHTAGDVDGQTLVAINCVLQPLAHFALATPRLADDKEEPVIRIQRPGLDDGTYRFFRHKRLPRMSRFANIHANIPKRAMGLEKQIAHLLAALGREHHADTLQSPADSDNGVVVTLSLVVAP